MATDSNSTGSNSNSRHVLIGQSPRMRSIQRLIDKVGRHRWPVLLLGETGTGKEVVARAIHNVEPDGPFVTIDCSALVGPLMESELFGHAKGSFTGAIVAKTGLIELANGGTAFLDEIGELPLDLQVKLLRVLQEKEFRPVGALQTRRSNFRVIAATNRDLAKEVDHGAFRRDLYYRLNVVSMRLAPLRERTEDVPALIAHFLKRHGCDHRLTQETLEGLLAYAWPGNVRELENSIQHMVAINSGPLLHFSDLPSPIQNAVRAQRGAVRAMSAGAGGGNNGSTAASTGAAGSSTASGHTTSAPPPVRPADWPLQSSESGGGCGGAADMRSNGTVAGANGQKAVSAVRPLHEVERDAIREALEYTKGDRAMAAYLLQIGRTTLYRKVKEYQLDN